MMGEVSAVVRRARYIVALGLLDMVTYPLRAVTVQVNQDEVLVRFIFDQTPDSSAVDDVAQIENDMDSALRSHFVSVSCHIEVSPFPESMLIDFPTESWVFLRKEYFGVK